MQWAGGCWRVAAQKRFYRAVRQHARTVRALLFGQMAPHVVDLRGAQRPRDARTGRADVPGVLRRLHKAAATAERPLTLNLSGAEGAAWGEIETSQLVQGLFRAARDAGDDEADILAQLGELWLHHTQLNDGSCGELAQLITRAVSLREMHMSDTAITLEGVRMLTSAAEAAGCGSGGRLVRQRPQAARAPSDHPHVCPETHQHGQLHLHREHTHSTKFWKYAKAEIFICNDGKDNCWFVFEEATFKVLEV